MLKLKIKMKKKKQKEDLQGKEFRELSHSDGEDSEKEYLVDDEEGKKIKRPE